MTRRSILLFEALAVTATCANGGANAQGYQDAALLDDFVAEIRATEDAGTATLDVVLQDSFDNGVTWNTWITFTQLTASGGQVVAAARPPGGLVRAFHTIGGTGTYTYRVRLSANPLR